MWDFTLRVLAAVLAAVTAAAVIGLAIFVYNNLAPGAIARALGGVPQQEFDSALKKQAEIFQAALTKAVQENRSSSVPSKGVVVAFDGQCPAGWSIVKDLIGSSIVGATTRPPDQYNPGRYDFGVYDVSAKPPAPSKKPPEREPRNFAPNEYEFINPYFIGAKSAFVPTFYGMTYCRQNYSDFPDGQGTANK